MPRESIRETIERRARRAILEHAILRVENAVIVAGVILLSFFLPRPLPAIAPWWDWWMWVALGAAGIILIAISSLTDAEEAARVVERLFQQEYNINGLRREDLKGTLKRAEEYHTQIKNAVASQRSDVLRGRLKRTSDQIYDWIGHMVRLARRIDAYYNDPIIQSDREEVKRSIPSLDNRLRLETDPQVRSQLETTLNDKRRLQQNIAELDSRMQRAGLQLESSLASLATVYSQLLLVDSKEVDSGRAERLQGDIADEVDGLQDVVDSINEIYDYHTLGPGL